MQRLALTLSLVLSATGTFACSSDSSDDGGGEETGGSGGSATGGTSGASTGGATTGGSAGASTGGSTTGGSTTGGSGGAGAMGGSGGSGGSGGAGFTKRGSCGHKSATNTVTLTSFEDTTEEYYVISQEALEEGLLDQYICLIRFDVTRVGDGVANCVDLDGAPCEWTHKVRVSSPQVVMNVDGACEKNEMGWNAAWIATIDGTEPSYGYVSEYQGHDSVVMTSSGAAYSVLGRASWDEMTFDFSFDTREACRY